MRIYVNEMYASDEWMVNSLNNLRNRLMKRYNLKSLTFSYTLPSASGKNFSVLKEDHQSIDLIDDLERLTNPNI